MNKIYKKLITISLGVSAFICCYSGAFALNETAELNGNNALPVSSLNVSEEKDSKCDSKECFAAELGEKVIEKGSELVKDEIKNKMEENDEKAEEVKTKFGDFVDEMKNNLEEISKTSDDAQKKAEEQNSQINELKEQKDELNSLKEQIELKKQLADEFNQYSKNSNEATNKFKEGIDSIIDSAKSKSSSESKK